MNKKQIDTKHILFVSQYPNQRTRKIAKALYNLNYKLTLLCCESGDEEYNQYFSSIIYLTPIDKLISFLKKKNIYYDLDFEVRKLLYKRRDTIFKKYLKKYLSDLDTTYSLLYAIDLSMNNWLPYFTCKYSESKFIYDSYDIFSIYMKHTVEKHLGTKEKIQNEEKYEKYCIENSSGIVLKNHPNILKVFEKKQYKVNKKKFLHFMDYCEDENIIEINYNKNIKREKINIVYTGDIKYSSSNKAESFSELYLTIKKINDKRILFHIYSNAFNNKLVFDQYKTLETMGLAKIYKYVPLKQLVQEISKYDYGIASFMDFNLLKNVEDDYISFSYGNRVSTILEAGLPLISIKEFKSYSNFIEKYNIGVTISSNELSHIYNILEEVNYTQLLKNIESVRNNEYNLYKQAPRLDKFIREIIEESN